MNRILVNIKFVIAVLAIACLTTLLLIVAPTRSSTFGPVYDPWLDVNNDNRIDMKDVSSVAKAFGAQGTFGQNVSKASVEYDSGWIDMTDKAGQDIVIAHDLNSTDLIVDVQGKNTLDSGPHQRNYGLAGYLQGWNRTYGGTGDDEVCALVQTTDGGYGLVGLTGSFGAGPTDFWLIKTDSAGKAQWNRTYGGTEDDWASALVQTSDGGYAIAGRTNSFGAGLDDFWLVKTDASGNAQWNKTYGGTGDDWALALVQTTDGGYALGGYTQSFGAGWADFWLVRTDALGNMLWNKTFGGTNYDRAQALVQTADGGYALAGVTRSLGAGNRDFWLVRTDALGNMLWNKTFGGTEHEWADALVQTTDEGYALAGMTNSSGAGGNDFWLVKTDSVGNAQWDRTYGGTGDDWALALVQTTDGGYALAGYTISFGAGLDDFWLVKTDSVGNAQWNQTYGAGNWDVAQALTQMTDGGYALAGYTISFGAGSEDFWLVRTDASGNVGGVEFGLAWVDSSANTITLYRGTTDPYWNFVRVRIWKPKTP